MPVSPRSLLAGIFCLGLSVIMFEIALTRVFAIMMWHHFTYMVISIGLLGFGASGSLLTATRLGLKEGTAERVLVWTSLGYGVSVVLAFCFATLLFAVPCFHHFALHTLLLAGVVTHSIWAGASYYFEVFAQR